MNDLFDVLNVGTREDSYTSLLAALFAEKPRWAREFFQQSTGADSLPPKPVETHKWPRATVSGGAVIPDLLLTFGAPVAEVWIVEAKLEAREDRDQLAAREGGEARESLSEDLGLPEDARWHYSYLTLEGETPATARLFSPASFEPLTEIFTKKPSLPDEVHPAYETLRKRLRDYYKARRKKPDPGSTLGGYLADTGGLISTRSRFYWLGERLAEDLKLESELGLTGGRRVVPLCQMRDSGWRGLRYVKASETPLKDCHDVHLELQLSEEEVDLSLHYETSPYMPRLKSQLGRYGVTEKQYDEYRERRKEFATTLSRQREELEAAGWTITSPGSANQLAKLQAPLTPETTVEETRKTLRASAKAMRSAVNTAFTGG